MRPAALNRSNSLADHVEEVLVHAGLDAGDGFPFQAKGAVQVTAGQQLVCSQVTPPVLLEALDAQGLEEPFCFVQMAGQEEPLDDLFAIELRSRGQPALQRAVACVQGKRDPLLLLTDVAQ